MLDPALTGKLLDRLRQPAPQESPLSALSAREREILDLVADGLSNREISERLVLAEKTVRNYVSNLLSKLNLQRRTQAAVLALELRRDTPPTRP